MAFASMRLHTVRVVVGTDETTAGDAMRLAHDGGVEGGFVRPNPTGMRFNPAFLNPGTQFAVAYADDEPIASLVLIEDGPFGLPSDRAFIEELDGFRQAGDSVFEAGGWVIAKDWRRYTMLLGALLFSPAMRMNLASREPRRMIVVVEPHRAKMVAGIFAPELITEPRLYLMLPGTLLVTRQSLYWPDDLLDPDALTPRRIVAERVFDPDPDWLQIGGVGPEWTDTLLPDLVRESGLDQRLADQMQLLDGASMPVRHTDSANGSRVRDRLQV